MKRSYFKISLLVLLASATVITSSCRRFRCKKGSGNLKTETRQTGDFSRLEIKGAYNVLLKQDSSKTLTITADDNLLQYIETSTSGNTLKINSRRSLCTGKAITVTVGVRNIEDIKASGSVEVKSEGRLNVKDISFELKGATKVELDMSATNVRADGKGSTELVLRGQAATADVHLTGSGKLNALDFVVGRYNLSTTGASECNVNVLNELNIKSTGASDVKYRGNPTISTDKKGSVSVNKVQ
ncbi:MULTISPECIES: head GIN domain-containing protein [unclassified Mucilaginibacter]|uniref:head GIN domain-containing protein n=1 Tax=unclassified Mucilaginibacter TaxID=2617802 RepID=UPI00095EA79D|nr:MULTISPECIES: head GIN domain-containing protein [unclassified Mucilaginibacter]OJW14791.1 MAG: hypothetical protein BGO48_11455 [Mucilaginibacter sp. 44-25]PLW88631.1 MAG: hypothetical protein C0154_15635 [Mucilaginibacter sp.]HEK20789.1 DUF2807 domain-containing protein [Bacteroidota bacterium]